MYILYIDRWVIRWVKHFFFKIFKLFCSWQFPGMCHLGGCSPTGRPFLGRYESEPRGSEESLGGARCLQPRPCQRSRSSVARRPDGWVRGLQSLASSSEESNQQRLELEYPRWSTLVWWAFLEPWEVTWIRGDGGADPRCLGRAGLRFQPFPGRQRTSETEEAGKGEHHSGANSSTYRCSPGLVASIARTARSQHWAHVGLVHRIQLH